MFRKGLRNQQTYYFPFFLIFGQIWKENIDNLKKKEGRLKDEQKYISKLI